MTILAPTGKSRSNTKSMPHKKQPTEVAEEQSTTLRYERHMRIAVSAGKMIKDEIRSAPIRRIPITIVTEVRRACTIWYIVDGVPVAFAKLGSKVTANKL